MKIQESSCDLPNPRMIKPSLTEQDFENWLQSPYKQSTGDEYYWQHQEQIQKSDLTFKVSSQCSKNASYLIKETRSESINSGVDLASPQTEPTRSIILEQEQNTVSVKDHDTIMQLQFKKPEIVHDIISVNQFNPSVVDLSDPTQSETMNPNLNDLKPQFSFKNHHLFLQNQEAELTLSHFSENAQEEKELIHTLKLWLKNKGIKLNKLIINGVPHD